MPRELRFMGALDRSGSERNMSLNTLGPPRASVCGGNRGHRRVPDRSWGGQLAAVARLSLPLVVVQVGYHLTGVVDTALAGRVDELTVAATGLGATVFFVVTVFGVGVALGVDPLAAQAFGAGEPVGARRVLWQGLYVAVLVAFPLSLLVIAVGLCLEPMGVAAELAEPVRSYVYARLPSLLPLLACVTLRSYLQAAHVTTPIVMAAVATNALNFLADWILLFGDSGLAAVGLPGVGLPTYGVAGIGWASTVAVLAQLAVLGYAVASRPVGAGRQPLARPAREPMRQVLRLGVPVGLQLVAEVGVFGMVSVLMGGMGSLPMASHQVALMLASTTFAACLGVGAATSVQVGRAVGAGSAIGAQRAGLSGIGLGMGFMMIPAIAMWLVPEALARLMTTDPDVVAASARLVRIAGVFQIVDGAQAVAAGALRGAGETRWPLVANLAAHWVVGMPVGAWLAFRADLGPAGLWWGLTLGLACVAVVLSAKFAHLRHSGVDRLRPDAGRA
jgi:MATE family multidrug resistance protein